MGFRMGGQGEAATPLGSGSGTNLAWQGAGLGRRGAGQGVGQEGVSAQPPLPPSPWSWAALCDALLRTHINSSAKENCSKPSAPRHPPEPHYVPPHQPRRGADQTGGRVSYRFATPCKMKMRFSFRRHRGPRCRTPRPTA